MPPTTGGIFSWRIYNMIHQYKQGGYNIVLDVCSGSVHVVDEVAYDIIEMYKSHTAEEITSKINALEPAGPVTTFILEGRINSSPSTMYPLKTLPPDLIVELDKV